MPSSPSSRPAAPDLPERLRRLEAENQRLRQELAASLPEKQDALERLHVAESHLQERERDLRSILDHMPAMIGYWDKNLRNRFSNYAYLEWFGKDPADIPGRHIREVIGEERYRLNLPYIEGALRGEAQLFERAIPTPDGSKIRHSLAHYVPDWVAGEVQGFYVLVTETTSLKEIQAALSVSEERYRAVIEDQTEMIARFAEDGTYSFVNNAFCRFFGKTAEELLGQVWTPACYPADRPRVEAQLRTLSPEQATVIVENRVYSGSGDIHWMQFINRGFFDADGRLIEIQAVGRDITERKNAEAALRQAHAQLEQRVVERTEQLRHLAIQTTLAEERERQAIARDLHDGLGQLLHVAKIKFDLLLQQLPAADSASGTELDALLADASRMVRSLTTQLSPPVLSKLGLTHALHWLGEEMDRHYGLRVDIDSPPSLPPLAPEQASILFRSARELLINVAKHSGSEQARLVLTVLGEQLVLSVDDAGRGIDNVAEALTKTQGFGLASIRERLTYLGGASEITSATGAGLRVTLRMPLTAAPSLNHPVSR
ncbi:MAG: sensor signal transduction histidine kinase [Proteobacteria bacterium]|nr:sensor signal transduction histidine kinase [Pseudomonadota bacterium]